MNEGAIITEFRKRPFLRPLLFWIVGIILEVCFPLETVSFALPAVVFVLVVLSMFTGSDKPSYDNRWLWGAVFAMLTIFLAIQMTALTECRLRTPTAESLLLQKAHKVQAAMVERLAVLRLPDNDKSVLATMTVNYRRLMTAELRSQFSVTGVSHLLAVSGFHVGIVCAFVSTALSFLPKRQTFFRWLHYVLTMLLLWAFAYISGLSAASVRAAVMISIYLTGKVLRRNADKYNTLASAAFLMLVYNPFYLFDVGFQLSFVSVFFILYFQPKFASLIEVKNPAIATFWNVITISIAAQIGTIPLCFHYFGQSSAVFLFTNLFLSLLATVLIPATLMFMILPLWLPGMGVLQVVVEALTRRFMTIVEAFANIPGASFSARFDFLTMILSYVFLALIMLYIRARRFWMLFGALIVLFGMLCWQFFR